MAVTTNLVLGISVVLLLAMLDTVRVRLMLFLDAVIGIADETFFVLLCTYCVLPLLIRAMHNALNSVTAEARRAAAEKSEDTDKSFKKTERGYQDAKVLWDSVNNPNSGTSKANDYYGFFANAAFTTISVLILLRITKELFGINVSSIFNFASTLSVGLGFAFNETINNFISGVIIQMSLGLRHGDLIQGAGGAPNDIWCIKEVGTMGMTVFRKVKKENEEPPEYNVMFMRHSDFLARSYTRLMKKY